MRVSTLGLGTFAREVAPIFAVALLGAGGAVASAHALSTPSSRDAVAPLRSASVALGASARVDANGARVPVAHGTRELTVGLVALGRAGSMRDVSGGALPVIAGEEVRIARGPGVVEWWRELPIGLEQGVTIDARPGGEGPLVLEMSAGEGTRAARVSDDELALADDETGSVLGRYAHLVVLDARGERVPARLGAVGGRIRIDVDDAGALYPLVVDPIVAVEEATLIAPARAVDDEFGTSAAISADGTRILVGAYAADPGGLLDAGMAYVFLRTGASWALEATLVASDAAASDGFGISIALTPDATRALVGVYGDDTATANEVGSARVFVRTGTTWSEEATLAPSGGADQDGFGVAVALSADGTRALVGAPLDDRGFSDTNDGSARIFRRSGSTWVEEASLVSSDAEAQLGWGVALDAAGDIAVVGAPDADLAPGGPESGVARVYRRSGTTWTEAAPLPPGPPQLNRFLGLSVAITPDGSRILVGAPYENVASGTDTLYAAGAAHMYVRSGASWVEEAVLTNPVPTAGDHFGIAVALTASGSRALVGADRALVGSFESGAAYLFLRRGSGWTMDATLLASARADNDRFGYVAALAEDGSRAVIGAYLDDISAPLDDAGSATVFSFPPAGRPCTDASDCGSGECVDGVCCDLGCGGTVADCQGCLMAMTGRANGTCAPTLVGTECRAVATLCDRAEACDGTSTACPPNAAATTGTPCRPSTGACDAQEVCDGASLACPGDVLAAPGVVCRAEAGDCDVIETCSGTTSACPPDLVESLGSPCRLAAGACDVAEACTGASAACPADAFAVAGVVCDGATSGDCDAADTCTGMSASCPPTFLSGVECRGSAGGCDAPEVCSGTTNLCPPDGLLPSGVVCRTPSDSSCDPAEACTGLAATCPTDVTMCGGPDAGPAIDAGSGRDGGTAADAGFGPDASVAPDAGPPRDAGPAPTAITRCSCRAVRQGPSSGAGAALAVLGLLVATRRRRALRSRSS